MRMLYKTSEHHQHGRRDLIDLNIASNKRVVQPRIIVGGNNNNLSLWPGKSDLDTNAHGLKTINTILKDGSDLIGAPARLVHSIQQNWLIYLVLIAIILVCILLLYYIIRCHCSKTWTCLTGGANSNNQTPTPSLKKTMAESPLLSKKRTDEV